MTSEEEHIAKNNLTDINSRFVAASPDLGRAYIQLPDKQFKLAQYLFLTICNEVRYEKGGVKEGYNYISNIYPVTIDGILLNIRQIDYNEGKKIDNDRKNYKGYLKDLHDGNIFYMWKCGKFYIFIMEREIRSWLLYNKDGWVTPKTIMKILDRAQCIINDMIRAHNKGYSRYKVIDIESSFGVFMNTMIDKMNPCIAEGLLRWQKDMHINDYLSKLMVQLESLETFDGLAESPDYMDRLPKDVMINIMKKNNGGNMSSSIENDIAPKGEKANLGKKTRKKRNTKKKVARDPKEAAKPKKARYDKELLPLEKGPDLIKYYHAYLQQLANSISINFEDVQVDSRVSVEIIDLLREHNVSNKEFLNAWIKYFYEHSLKGNKVSKSTYTALRTFRYTFERFKEAYYVS